MFKHYFGMAVSILFIIVAAGCGPAKTEAPASVLPPATTEPTLTGTAAPEELPRFEKTKCAFPIPEGFQPECGYLIVPEDRSQPDGRTIRLHVAVCRSTNSNPAPDPVNHLIGGPGSSALNNAQWILMRGGTEILKQRDYILFDQRGTQYSDPYLYCLPYDQYLWDAHVQNLSLAEYNAGSLPLLSACLEDWRQQGIDIAAYNSAESAADVNDLRLVLGYHQVNLYGISYGTRLALNILRDHPEGIRSVIIDSIYPPQVNLDLDLALNANRSLQEVFQACAADDTCSSKYGDIEGKFYTVIDRLEAAPVVIHAPGPYRDQLYAVYMDGDLFIDVIFVQLYSMASIADIPYLIHAAYEGSYADFPEPVGGSIGSPLSTILFWSTTCGEEVPFEIDAQEPAGSASLPAPLREHFIKTYTLNVCDLWDIPPADPKENEAVLSDIPTLLFSGRYDPVTPPGYGELAAQTLSNHYFYEFPDMAHGVMRSEPCALQIGLAFFDDPLHAPDSSCMNDLAGSVEFR
jgi:pimeloyl-ACP methyl ester carboxylesterase